MFDESSRGKTRITGQAPIRHGGDLAVAEARFGQPSDGWLDLSTGINPYPYPAQDLAGAGWFRLPGNADHDALADAAGAYFGIGDAARVVPAPGTQSIIQWLPRLREAGCVAVVGPTYAEHARTWRAAGHEVTEVGDIESATAADVAVVVNPNNPDGRRIPPAKLLETAEVLAGRGGWLVVDEAFADAVPEASVAPWTGMPGLIVLRSFGKFFGLAGLRLGFAVAEAELAERVRQALGPWAVSGPATVVGRRAYGDWQWIAETRDKLGIEAERLDAVLRGAGIEVRAGCPLYRLAVTADAAALFDHLGRQGIYVRAFDDIPNWLRFGLPGGAENLNRLGAALADWRGTGRGTD